MKILTCINNKILAKGVATIIKNQLPDATLEFHCFGLHADNPDLVLFSSRDDILDLQRHYPKANFLCFDLGMADSELACLLYCHGVRGIISPSLDIDKFCKALHKVYNGEVWLDQKHLLLLLQQGKMTSNLKPLRQLSDQDLKIVQMVADGETNKVIASKLCLSPPTIKAHLSRIFRRLNVENRSQLAALATTVLNPSSM